jgi:hypothetical protein
MWTCYLPRRVLKNRLELYFLSCSARRFSSGPELQEHVAPLELSCASRRVLEPTGHVPAPELPWAGNSQNQNTTDHFHSKHLHDWFGGSIPPMTKSTFLKFKLQISSRIKAFGDFFKKIIISCARCQRWASCSCHASGGRCWSPQNMYQPFLRFKLQISSRIKALRDFFLKKSLFHMHCVRHPRAVIALTQRHVPALSSGCLKTLRITFI